MSEEKTTTSTITDEESFHDIVESEREKRRKDEIRGPFEDLSNAIHEALKRQDSDGTLELITR